MSRKKSSKNNKFNFFRLIISFFITVIIIFLGSKFLPNNSPFCANSISCIKNLKPDIENTSVGIFDSKKVVVPEIFPNQDLTNSLVLGVSTSPGPKHIYVDLTNQILYAYQGKDLVMKTFISSGKWHPTPDGTFNIWVKLRSTRMTGGSGADYYDLPNVPYVMFFYNNDVDKSEGFSLHGAYWHDNFGHPMSHGCVNMREIDAEALYNWVDPPTNGLVTYADSQTSGTPVTIFGTAPN